MMKPQPSKMNPSPRAPQVGQLLARLLLGGRTAAASSVVGWWGGAGGRRGAEADAAVLPNFNDADNAADPDADASAEARVALKRLLQEHVYAALLLPYVLLPVVARKQLEALVCVNVAGASVTLYPLP